MKVMAQLPAWLSTVTFFVAVVVIGYMLKILIQWLVDNGESLRARRAKLVELYALLRAGKTMYALKKDALDTLTEMVVKREPALAGKADDPERLLVAAFPGMTAEEKERFALIRDITVNALQPFHEALAKWLSRDIYYKTRTWGVGQRAHLAGLLVDLETHLLLWHAWYASGIPDSPGHACACWSEKNKPGFPIGLQDAVKDLLGRRWWFKS